MHSKIILFIFTGLFLGQHVGAVDPASPLKPLPPPPLPTCITGKVDYSFHQNDLPEVLQGIDKTKQGRMYRLSGFLARRFASAAIKLRLAENNKFVFDVGVAAPGKQYYFEETYIRKMCFEGDNVIITLENEQKYVAEITGKSSFELEGGSFEPTTPGDFAQEINAVKVKLSESKGSGTAPSKGSASSSTTSSGRK